MSSVAKLHLKLFNKTRSAEIKGESRIHGYTDQIEIDDWSWNLKPESRTGSGKGEDSIPVPSVVTLTKVMDSATTSMLLAMTGGDLLTGTITLEEVAADQFSLSIELTDVRLVGCDFDAKDGDKSALIEETWTLDYREIRFHHVWANATSTYEMERPGWAKSEAGAGSEKKKIAEMAKIAEEYYPGQLEAMWTKVKAQIEENKRKELDSKKVAEKKGPG